jgi:hypothetical protein
LGLGESNVYEISIAPSGSFGQICNIFILAEEICK